MQEELRIARPSFKRIQSKSRLDQGITQKDFSFGRSERVSGIQVGLGSQTQIVWEARGRSYEVI